jgi:hypothetical protein
MTFINIPLISILVYAVHPGIVATKIFNINPLLLFVKWINEKLGTFRSPEHGALTLIYAALQPDLKGVYFANQKPSRYHPKADDESAQDELWQWSMQVTGVHA